MFHRKLAPFSILLPVFLLCFDFLRGQEIPSSTPSSASPLTMVTEGMPLPSSANGSFYVEPQVPVKLFDAGKLGLSPEQRTKLATGISASLRLIASKAPGLPNNLATKSVAFAFNLDPENREATIANLQFKKGVQPQNVIADPGPATIAKELRAKALELKSSPDENSRTFRILALDLASELDPLNEELLLENESNRKAGEKADWSEVLPSPMPADNDPASPGPNKAFMVTLLSPAGQPGGPQSFKMMATAQSNREAKGTRLMVDGPLNPETLTAFQEAERFVKAKTPQYPVNTDIVIAFTPNYRVQYGPSSSVTLALLLLSLSGQANIDPEIPIVGVLKENGSIGAGRGIDLRAISPINRLFERAAISEEYTSDLKDLVLLKRRQILWENQFFFVKNLEEAKKLAAPQPDPQITKAMHSFTEARDILRENRLNFRPQLDPFTNAPTIPLPKTKNSRDPANSNTSNNSAPSALYNDAIRLKLEETLAAAPNHASAIILLQELKGTLPETVSLSGSINEIASIVYPLVVLAATEPGITFNGKLQTAGEKIDKLGGRVDPQVDSLRAELSILIYQWVKALKDPNVDPQNPYHKEFGEKIAGMIEKARLDYKVPSQAGSGF